MGKSRAVVTTSLPGPRSRLEETAARVLEMLGRIAISLGDALIRDAKRWRTAPISSIQSVYHAEAPCSLHESINRYKALLQSLDSRPKEQLFRYIFRERVGNSPLIFPQSGSSAIFHPRHFFLEMVNCPTPQPES